MALETVFLAVVSWILVASAAYYGSLQALETFFRDRPAPDFRDEG